MLCPDTSEIQLPHCSNFVQKALVFDIVLDDAAFFDEHDGLFQTREYGLQLIESLLLPLHIFYVLDNMLVLLKLEVDQLLFEVIEHGNEGQVRQKSQDWLKYELEFLEHFDEDGG